MVLQRGRTFIGVTASVYASTVFSIAAADDRVPLQGDPTDYLPKIQIPSSNENGVVIEQSPGQQPASSAVARTVVPGKIQIEGVKSIQFEEVAALFANLTGKKITVEQLVNISQSIARVYQKHGYAMSFGYVPEQDFADGVVRVAVVEGYVSEIRLQGEPGNAESKIRDIAGNLLDERPLKQATFERYVNALGLIPGLQTKASLAPPQTTEGAAVLTLNVSIKPVSLSLGTDYNHPGVRGIATLTTNSLTPLAEQIQVSALAPAGRDKEHYYAASYSQPVGDEGLVLKASVTLYKSNPRDPIVVANQAVFRRELKNERLSLQLSYPLVLKNSESLTATVGVYAANNEDRYVAIGAPVQIPLTTDIRAVQGELAWAQVTPGRVRRASVAAYQGLDAAGARLDNTMFDLDFTRFTAQFSQRDEWSSGMGTAFAFAGQFSDSSLPTSEQISFGGTSFGKAYAPGLVAGDTGWGASFEVNRRIPLSARYITSVQPYAVLETAYVRANEFALLLNRLTSFAVGFRLTDGKHYSIGIDAAKPIGDLPPSNPDRDSRFNFSFSYQFE
jgi:hemolysin activation/secretion protein